MPYPEEDYAPCPKCNTLINITIHAGNPFVCPYCGVSLYLHITVETVDPQPIDPRHIC